MNALKMSLATLLLVVPTIPAFAGEIKNAEIPGTVFLYASEDDLESGATTIGVVMLDDFPCHIVNGDEALLLEKSESNVKLEVKSGDRAGCIGWTESVYFTD